MKFETELEQLIYAIVRIETEESDNKKGLGTSFVFNCYIDKTTSPFLVTNKHIVEGVRKGYIYFTQANDDQPQIGKVIRVPITDFEDAWCGHPDPDIDIAVMPLGEVTKVAKEQGLDLYYKSIPLDLIPTDNDLSDLDLMQDIIILGYPEGMYDQLHNYPLIRKGITASPPNIDFNGIKIFLIDASVYKGSSGSPVLIYNRGIHKTRENVQIAGKTYIKFLGVVGKASYSETKGIIETVQGGRLVKSSIKTKEMIDLGVVYKASTVLETVDEYLKKRGVKRDQ